MLVIRIASLQASLGFQILVDDKVIHRSKISDEVASQRIRDLSRNIQISKVLGFDLIRVGGSGDGGYVMLNNLDNIDGVLSLGIGQDVSWDLEISQKVRLIHLYDHTIEGLPELLPGSQWFKEKIVAKGDPTGTSFEDAIKRLPNSNRLILKCDIEDSEWEIISNCDSEILGKFDQIVMEFHWLTDKLFTQKYELMLQTFEKIAQTHSVINIHGNNYANFEIIANSPIPDVIEISYARTKSYNFELNNSNKNLNMRNHELKPEIYLNFPIIL
jgi:hypothetical protein